MRLFPRRNLLLPLDLDAEFYRKRYRSIDQKGR